MAKQDHSNYYFIKRKTLINLTKINNLLFLTNIFYISKKKNKLDDSDKIK